MSSLPWGSQPKQCPPSLAGVCEPAAPGAAAPESRPPAGSGQCVPTCGPDELPAVSLLIGAESLQLLSADPKNAASLDPWVRVLSKVVLVHTPALK